MDLQVYFLGKEVETPRAYLRKARKRRTSINSETRLRHAVVNAPD